MQPPKPWEASFTTQQPLQNQESIYKYLPNGGQPQNPIPHYSLEAYGHAPIAVNGAFRPAATSWNQSHDTYLGDRVGSSIDAIMSTIRMIGNLVQMVDSTAYAAWSAVMAFATVSSRIGQLRRELLDKWLLATMRLLRRLSGHFRSSDRTPRRGKIPQLLVPLALLGAIVLVLKTFEKRKVRVVYPFVAADDSCLSVAAGELVEVSGQTHGEWVFARNRAGQAGFIPRSYLSWQ